MGSSYGASNSMWRNRYVTETSRAASFAEHNELDCTTTPNGDDSRTEHLVALGASPADSLLHASSADNEFGAFLPKFLDRRFSSSAGVTTHLGTSVYRFAGVDPTGIFSLREDVDGAVHELPLPAEWSVPTSGIDNASVSARNTGSYQFAAFRGDETLVIYWYTEAATGTSNSERQLAAPSGLQYKYSPSICAYLDESATTHIVVVAAAGEGLWYATSDDDYEWTQIEGVSVASSPDCALSAAGELHVVARTSDGTVTHIRGPLGALDVENLGTF